jgi:phytoene dehydrogenase-like protein
MSKSIIIIGGGIAGLSAGIYARMNGFETNIYEMHSNAGGLCTSWKKKDYIFDGCIYCLTGISPSTGYYQFWEEIGAIQGKKFLYYDYIAKIMNEDGKIFTIYTDPDKLKDELLAIAPEDEKIILRFTHDLKILKQSQVPVDFRFPNVFMHIPLLRIVYKYRISAEEMAQKFKNPVIRTLFTQAFDWHGMSLIFLLWGMGLMAAGNAGYPIGGSSLLINSVLDRYLKLGGKIHYNSKIEKILVENNKATGIKTTNGEEGKADIIISAADGYSTIFKWLEGKFLNKKIQRIYNEFEPFPPLLYISLGINADYSSEPDYFTFPVKEVFSIGPQEIKHLSFKNYSRDPILCPAGKSIFIFMLPTNYDYWAKLKQDETQYISEKKRVEEHIILALSHIYPEIRSQIEVVDIATPMTFTRYTGNWKGSYEGWLLTKKSMTIQIPQTLPELSNFYMAGHWLSPGGGLPSGLLTARKVIQKICKKEGIKFITTRG